MNDDEVRIILLGKTGVGKSAAGNTILGENKFDCECSLKSQTQVCTREEKEIGGKRLVVVDTPGICDTDRPEDEIRKEIISSLVKIAPGPHVVIVVLEIARHTEENKKSLEKLIGYFNDQIFSHMVVLFTHGDKLPEGTEIEDFVADEKSGNSSLKELIQKCGNRVHVFDNMYWNEDRKSLAFLADLKNDPDPEQALKKITEILHSLQTQFTKTYRSNQFQLNKLMESINTILRENNYKPYRNQALEETGKAINEEVEKIIQELKDAGETQDPSEIRRRAIERVNNKIQKLMSGVATGILLGALLGVGVAVAAPVVLVAGLIRAGWRKITRQRPQAGDEPADRGDVAAGSVAAGVSVATGVATEVAVGVTEGALIGAGVGTGIGAAVGAGILLLYGVGKGGKTGFDVSKSSDNPQQAADKASKAVVSKAGDVLKACWNLGSAEAEEEDEYHIFENE